MTTLHAETRDAKGSLKELRARGYMPAVFYGKKEASTPISLKTGEFLKVWKEAGESSVITIERTEGDVEALIKEVAVDPVTGNPLHVDFYVFEKGKAIEIKVPIEFEGESPAVKEGGVLVKVLHEIEISAQPKNLPHQITVDISSLAKLEDQILVQDLKLPEGVTLVQNPEDVVVLVTEAKEEPVEEAPVNLEDIQLSEERGKKDEESTEAPAAE